MNERGLVEVPENAVRDEPIAFGLTGVQLGICGLAVPAAAVLNLLPLWEPVRLVLIVLGAGPVFVAAALPIAASPGTAGSFEPFGTGGGGGSGRPSLRAPDKPEISGVDETGTISLPEPAMTETACPSPLRSGRRRWPYQPRPPCGPRSCVVDPSETPKPSPNPPRPSRTSWAGSTSSASCPFAGGVGKTTLAVEAASLVGSRARYRTLHGETRPLRVLLLDAARTSPAASLRLGLDSDTVSRAQHALRLAGPGDVREAGRRDPLRRDLWLPPQLPMRASAPSCRSGRLRRLACSTRPAVRASNSWSSTSASSLEEGHRYFISRAARRPGVVTPRVEALPDVIRITSYIRARRRSQLAFVANRATDEGSLPALADEEQVPIVATIPDLPAFDVAGDRGVPAWTDDAEVEGGPAPAGDGGLVAIPGRADLERAPLQRSRCELPAAARRAGRAAMTELPAEFCDRPLLSAKTLGSIRARLVARPAPEVLNPFDRTPEREATLRAAIGDILTDPELDSPRRPR
ncbi:MAG: hypothetical protein M5T61_17075 [Acidimicrobiia bacterium]|nr:hypothetical protein [Acidimicrobiia bacterium]